MGIGYKIARGSMDALGALPLKFHYAWSSAISWFLYHVLHYRVSVVRTNIARSFPQMSYKDVDMTVKKFYSHLGDIFAEAIWYGGCKNYKRLRAPGIVRVKGFNLVEEAVEGGQNVMVLASHAGNWELVGGLEGYVGEMPCGLKIEECRVIYKRLSSKTWDEVFKANRVAPHGHYECALESRDVLRQALEHRNDRRFYIFPTDQCPYKSATVHYADDFLHQKTTTMVGGASLARKLDMAVFILHMPSEGRGHYVMEFEKLCDHAAGYQPLEIMNLYYKSLQKEIEAQPWNYLWTHKRWKNNR